MRYQPVRYNINLPPGCLSKFSNLSPWQRLILLLLFVLYVYLVSLSLLLKICHGITGLLPDATKPCRYSVSVSAQGWAGARSCKSMASRNSKSQPATTLDPEAIHCPPVHAPFCFGRYVPHFGPLFAALSLYWLFMSRHDIWWRQETFHNVIIWPELQRDPMAPHVYRHTRRGDTDLLSVRVQSAQCPSSFHA